MTAALGPPNLPKFTYVRHLGGGGFADVYLCRQGAPSRDVAVKVLRELANTDEADTMAAVSDHEHIVSIFAVETAADGRLCLVMAYYPGPTFDDRYLSAPLGIDEVLQTGVKLCGALATAHQAGILHRDIKPSNILTSAYGEPGLTDFGIAVSSSGGHIQEGASLPWAPPEVLKRQPPDERADVYGIAATLFTLLEGHAPYSSATESNDDRFLIGRTLNDPVPTLTRDDAPTSLIRLLEVAMARDPNRRIPTAEQLGRELQKIENERALPITRLLIPTPQGVARTNSRVSELRDDPNRTKLKLPKVVHQDHAPPNDHTIARISTTERSTDRNTPQDWGPHEAFINPLTTVDDETISEQSPRRASSIAPPPRPPEERTQVRSTRTPADETAQDGSDGTKPWWVWLISAIGAAVVGVVLITTLGNSSDDDDGDGQFGFETTLPQVQLARVKDLKLTVTGVDSATVSWTGPAELAGGHFNWSRCDASDPTTQKTGDEEAGLTGLTIGERVCVQVSFQAADGNESDDERVEISSWTGEP